MKKDQTRHLLLDTAKGIVERDGHEAITVRRIAQLSGYTFPMLYHHFEDMNALLWALRLQMIDDMIQELSSPENSFVSSPDELKRQLKAYICYYLEKPNIFRFFYFYPFKIPCGDTGYDKVDTRMAEIWQMSISFLTANGGVPPARLEAIIKTILYSMHGLILLSLSQDGNLTQASVCNELDAMLALLLPEWQSI